MAKKKITRTLYDLLHVDISSLTTETISQYFKAARENVRKSIARWEKREYKSPAYYAFYRATGGTLKLNFRKKTLNEKKKELAKAITFLRDPTRTIKGWEAEKIKNIATLKKKKGIELTPEEYDFFYSTYEKARELDPNVGNSELKYHIFEYLLEEMRADPTQSKDELAVKVVSNIEKFYEEIEKEHRENMRNWSEEFR